MPLSTTAWTCLLAIGVALAGAGYEYDRRPIYSDPGRWTASVAYAVMVIGRMLVFLAVALFCIGEKAVVGGLHF